MSMLLDAKLFQKPLQVLVMASKEGIDPKVRERKFRKLIQVCIYALETIDNS